LKQIVLRLAVLPQLLSRVASAYINILKKLEFNRISAIPLASMPIATAISIQADIPMIYPRITAKKHGMGKSIEGSFNRGDRVVLIDDVITTGKSKLEATDILIHGGLVVKDLVVLIERGKEGREELAKAGISLHAVIDVQEIIEVCSQLKIINDKLHDEIVEFLKTS
jgi:uridine monophosphate synthetase